MSALTITSIVIVTHNGISHIFDVLKVVGDMAIITHDTIDGISKDIMYRDEGEWYVDEYDKDTHHVKIIPYSSVKYADYITKLRDVQTSFVDEHDGNVSGRRVLLEDEIIKDMMFHDMITKHKEYNRIYQLKYIELEVANSLININNIRKGKK